LILGGDHACIHAQVSCFLPVQPRPRRLSLLPTPATLTTERAQVGDRVGYGWLRDSCRKCRYCLRGEENLCLQQTPTIVGRESAIVGQASLLSLFGCCSRLQCLHLLSAHRYPFLADCGSISA
jgi:hypothetical protein